MTLSEALKEAASRVEHNTITIQIVLVIFAFYL